MAEMENYKKPTSIPKIFTPFTFKNLCESSDSIMSPTSILDTKPFSALKSPWMPSKTPESEPKHKIGSEIIGLGIANVLKDDITDLQFSIPGSKMVLFGSQLKIQIPTLFSSAESISSPTDFGLKTKNSHVGSFSPNKKSPFGSDDSCMNTPVSSRAIDMELSEDYTCVIAHGPVPRTTHIFDDCIVDSSYGFVKKNDHLFSGHDHQYSQSFLSSCFSCKKNLGQGNDIYMYRGEKAFCSNECRYKEMLLEDGSKLDDDDDVVYGTCY